MDQISRQDAAEVKRLVQALPVNRKPKPETRDLSLQDAIAGPGLPKLGFKTVDSYIDMFRRFWDWAERHGQAPEKLFVNMKIKQGKHITEGRKAYKLDQTAKLYAELTGNASGLVKKDEKKGALLGLYTGARLREIAQLDVADIRQEGGIWYLAINGDGPNKSLKTIDAKRRVPVHLELIRLGFLDWVAAKPEGQRLFLSFSYNAKEGYGRTLGRWFNTVLLPGLGMKESGLVFHSLRHTMVTRLAQAAVHEPLYQEIVGHEREGVAQQVYFKEGHTLAQKKDAIEKFGVSRMWIIIIVIVVGFLVWQGNKRRGQRFTRAVLFLNALDEGATPDEAKGRVARLFTKHSTPEGDVAAMRFAMDRAQRWAGGKQAPFLHEARKHGFA